MVRCGITIIEANMPPVTSHITLRKKHPLMKRLNESIKRNRHRLLGIALKYYRRAISYNQCPAESNYKPLSRFYWVRDWRVFKIRFKNAFLALSPFIGLLIVSFCIVGFAFLAFGMELRGGQFKVTAEQLNHGGRIRKRQRRFQFDWFECIYLTVNKL